MTTLLPAAPAAAPPAARGTPCVRLTALTDEDNARYQWRQIQLPQHERPVGGLGFTIDMTNPRRVWITVLVITRPYRRRGLGKAALGALTDELQGQDIAELCVKTTPAAPAGPFWAACEFGVSQHPTATHPCLVWARHVTRARRADR